MRTQAAEPLDAVLFSDAEQPLAQSHLQQFISRQLNINFLLAPQSGLARLRNILTKPATHLNLVVVDLGTPTCTSTLLAGALLARRHAVPLIVLERRPGDAAATTNRPFVRGITNRIISRVLWADQTMPQPPITADVLTDIGLTEDLQPDNGVGPVGIHNLPAITAIHTAAFPESAMTHLGAAVVERYYRWQFIGEHPAPYASGFWHEGMLVGFVFGGARRDAISGYARRFLPTLILNAARRPQELKRLAAPKVLQITRLMMRRTPIPQATAKPETSRPSDTSFGILSIAVAPQAQGSGAAQALLESAETSARSAGFQSMHLSVDLTNHRAIKFYTRCGWDHARIDGLPTGRMVNHLQC